MGVYLVVCIIYLFIFFSILTSTYLLIVRVEPLKHLITLDDTRTHTHRR